jgi:hypothetical protein
VVILTVAGLVLTALYRDTAEAALDEQLGVYLRALVADIASPHDDTSDAGQLAEPQFELPLSGWYWQITRLDVSPTDIRASRSLFATRLQRLPDSAAEPGQAGRRRGNIAGPDNKPLRMLERVINAGDQGHFLVQVAATTQTVDSQITQFEIDIGVTFFLLALLLVAAMAFQVRYGLRPLRQLRRDVVAVRRQSRDRRAGAHSGRQSRPCAENAAERHRQRGRFRADASRAQGRRAGRGDERPGEILSRPRPRRDPRRRDRRRR